jgi:predicted transcriptional regulator
MARKRARQKFTPLEFEIVSVLWSRGPGNVAAVQQALEGSPQLAYTSVQTMLNILCRKEGPRLRIYSRRQPEARRPRRPARRPQSGDQPKTW